MKKYEIIYHANCSDGEASAAVTIKHIIENLGGKMENITLHPAKYNSPHPQSKKNQLFLLLIFLIH